MKEERIIPKGTKIIIGEPIELANPELPKKPEPKPRNRAERRVKK